MGSCDRYFYERIKTLVEVVLPKFGVEEHMIRYEVQHRQVQRLEFFFSVTNTKSDLAP